MRVLEGIAATIGALALVVALVAAGFGACCLPVTTQLLSQATSNAQDAPYTSEQLTALAVATRDFTVDDYGRAAFGSAGAQDTLASATLLAARAASAEGSPVADRWSSAARSAVEEASDASPAASVFKLASVSDRYALDADALSHLEDCNMLIRSAVPWLWVAAGVAVVLIGGLALSSRHRAAAGRALTAAPIALIVVLAAAGVWAAIDFYGFFSAFHGVFFPQGNWTFSITSLLICMYPLGFWMGMGIVWLVVTVAACIICLIVGRRLRHGARR